MRQDRMLTANPHVVFSTGRLSRVVHPSSLAAFPSSHSATAAARPRLRTSVGCQRTAAQTLVTQVAREAEGYQDADLPERQDTAEPARQPAAPKRTKSSKAPVRNVPWSAATEAAVLQFWTAQGALLPDAEVQPKQQTEQRRIRSKILRWAAKYPPHRDVDFLTVYMARVDDATAGSCWAGQAWRFALDKHATISDHLDPAKTIQRVQAAQQEVAAHGIHLRPANSIIIAGFGKALAAKLVRLQPALDALPFKMDAARVARWAPTLIGHEDVGAVVKCRVAAMQQLHPQLDVARVFTKEPGLLSLKEATLAVRWAALQEAGGFSECDMRALVEVQPAILKLSPGVSGWKLRQIQAYQVASAGCTSISSVSRMLASAPFRIWCLHYLTEAASFHYAAKTWVTMQEDRFAALSPGYSSWLVSHPIPPEAYCNRYS